jgi:hypothetical protein
VKRLNERARRDPEAPGQHLGDHLSSDDGPPAASRGARTVGRAALPTPLGGGERRDPELIPAAP